MGFIIVQGAVWDVLLVVGFVLIARFVRYVLMVIHYLLLLKVVSFVRMLWLGVSCVVRTLSVLTVWSGII